MIPWLGSALAFPSVSTALSEPDGLLAAGGDLRPERLLVGYAEGIFPWYSEGQPILWWAPSRRMVIFPERLHVSRSLSKTLRKKSYRITIDHAFLAVMEACAAPRKDTGGTWIVPEMIEAYCRLHELGYAHSIEVWMEGELVGGLYGVGLGCMFYGESMFSRRRDASKIALVHLVRHLAACGVEMMDCQMHTEHLASMGGELVPRERFIATLRKTSHKSQPPSMWEYGYSNEPA